MRPSVDGQGAPAKAHAALEEVEETGQPWMLTLTEAKLLGIAGIGFFLDGEFLSSLTTSLHHMVDN